MKREEILDWISGCCELALLLEVSATPKPGLVDKLHDYRGETYFQHFIASAVSLRPWMKAAAKLGSKGRGLGKIIFKGVKAFMTSQRGGNTHLGAWLLIAPLAAAAGSSLKKPISEKDLRIHVVKVLRGMDWRDTISIFKAIAFTSPGGLGRVPYLDVLRSETYQEIRLRKIGPIDALKPYQGYDIVAEEWVGGYSRTLKEILKIIKKNLREYYSLDSALAQSYLEILARYPDTQIIRRAGPSTARAISHLARRIVEVGGLSTKKGRRMLIDLDRRLRRSRRLRPAATADLLSASIAALLLGGFKP